MKERLQVFSEYAALCMLTFMLFAGWVLTPQDLPDLGLCLFKKMFLLDCPGCGMTRAFLSLARGHFVRAFSYNPAAIPLYLFFTVVLFRKFFRWIFARWGLKASWVSTKKIRISRQLGFLWFQLIVILLMTNWIYKTSAYFSVHSWHDYVTRLSSVPLKDYAFMVSLLRF